MEAPRFMMLSYMALALVVAVPVTAGADSEKLSALNRCHEAIKGTFWGDFTLVGVSKYFTYAPGESAGRKGFYIFSPSTAYFFPFEKMHEVKVTQKVYGGAKSRYVMATELPGTKLDPHSVMVTISVAVDSKGQQYPNFSKGNNPGMFEGMMVAPTLVEPAEALGDEAYEAYATMLKKRMTPSDQELRMMLDRLSEERNSAQFAAVEKAKRAGVPEGGLKLLDARELRVAAIGDLDKVYEKCSSVANEDLAAEITSQRARLQDLARKFATPNGPSAGDGGGPVTGAR